MAILGGLLGGLVRNRINKRNQSGAQPGILRDIAAAAVDVAADRVVERIRTGQQADAPAPTPAQRETAIQETTEALSNHPVVVNNTNSERKTESRVVTGSIQSTLGALGTFFTGTAGLLGGFGGFGQQGIGLWINIFLLIFGGASGTGSLYALFGRLRDDLPPMYNRWWNPMSWLARDKEEVLTAPAAPEAIDGNA